MPTAALLFNGIHYSFGAVDQAIEWARKEQGSLVIFFLKAEEQVREGYVFPSDLDEAELLRTTDDATTSSENVIDSNIRMLTHHLHRENIPFTLETLTDPVRDDLKKLTGSCERIFTSKAALRDGIMTCDNHVLHRFLDHSGIPVEYVEDK